MKKVIFNGEPGERWTNDGPKVMYQFVAELRNTCGACLAYHMAISTFWPIPIHRRCRCRQTPVRPGQTAEPWVDFRAILDGMEPSQQRAAVGSSLYKLIKRGVVAWDDAVTGSRVRTLREVVARGKLTVDAMLKAGVREPIAQHAWQAVNTPELAVAKAHRKSLIQALEGAGAKRDKIIEAAAEKLADRIVVQGIDLGGAGAKPKPPIVPPGDLSRLLGLDETKIRAALKPKAKAEPKSKKAKEPMTPPREETDAPEFPPSKAEVVFAGSKSDQRAARRWIDNVLGENGVNLIASVAGAPDDATVTIEPLTGGILYTISHPKIETCQGEMRWWGPNETVHHPIIFEVKKGERGGGFGSRVHGRRVYWGQKLGFSHLTIDAGRGHDMNGYAVWPVVGYDGRLPFRADELPEAFRGAKTVQELLSLPSGVEWWREHGATTAMKFDLSPGSRNVYLWRRHWNKKPREATGE